MTSVPDVVFETRDDLAGNRARFYEYYGPYGKGWLITLAPGWGASADTIPDNSIAWSLTSWGPDLEYNNGCYFMLGPEVMALITAMGGGTTDCIIYDTTNGTMSLGDIVRIGP